MAVIETARLVLRPWTEQDAPAALRVFGGQEVVSWLLPGQDHGLGLEEMRGVLAQWAREDGSNQSTGNWAIETREGHEVVGGCALRLMPGDDTDVQMTWVLRPSARGHGYATEAGSALAHWVMHETDHNEVFALMHADNAHGAATATRIGMEWVTEVGHEALQVYRIRHADLGDTDIELEATRL